MNSSNTLLLHERCRPDFRDVFGKLARTSTEIDTAITRIRLSGIDLSPEELSPVRRFRVLLGEVNAHSLGAEADAAQTDRKRATTLEFLLSAIDRGAIEIRSAPLSGWSPDFSVFRSASAPDRLLAGLHWFERPYPQRGPVWGFQIEGPPASEAGLRFEEMWRYGHDIRAAIQHILRSARRRGAERSDPTESGPLPRRMGRNAGARTPLTLAENSD